jgi:hypothetical protein
MMEFMNMNNNCNRNGSKLPLTLPHDLPPHNNPKYSFSCSVPRYEDGCKDIRSGEYEFQGNRVIYGVCNMNKSYLIVKVEGDCEVKWNAVWANGKTLIDTDGDYKVIYKWDACCEGEPQFATAKVSCPCN